MSDQKYNVDPSVIRTIQSGSPVYYIQHVIQPMPATLQMSPRSQHNDVPSFVSFGNSPHSNMSGSNILLFAPSNGIQNNSRSSVIPIESTNFMTTSSPVSNGHHIYATPAVAPATFYLPQNSYPVETVRHQNTPQYSQEPQEPQEPENDSDSSEYLTADDDSDVEMTSQYVSDDRAASSSNQALSQRNDQSVLENFPLLKYQESPFSQKSDQYTNEVLNSVHFKHRVKKVSPNLHSQGHGYDPAYVAPTEIVSPDPRHAINSGNPQVSSSAPNSQPQSRNSYSSPVNVHSSPGVVQEVVQKQKVHFGKKNETNKRNPHEIPSIERENFIKEVANMARQSDPPKVTTDIFIKSESPSDVIDDGSNFDFPNTHIHSPEDPVMNSDHTRRFSLPTSAFRKNDSPSNSPPIISRSSQIMSTSATFSHTKRGSPNLRHRSSHQSSASLSHLSHPRRVVPPNSSIQKPQNLHRHKHSIDSDSLPFLNTTSPIKYKKSPDLRLHQPPSPKHTNRTPQSDNSHNNSDSPDQSYSQMSFDPLDTAYLFSKVKDSTAIVKCLENLRLWLLSVNYSPDRYLLQSINKLYQIARKEVEYEKTPNDRASLDSFSTPLGQFQYSGNLHPAPHFMFPSKERLRRPYHYIFNNTGQQFLITRPDLWKVVLGFISLMGVWEQYLAYIKNPQSIDDVQIPTIVDEDEEEGEGDTISSPSSPGENTSDVLTPPGSGSTSGSTSPRSPSPDDENDIPYDFEKWFKLQMHLQQTPNVEFSSLDEDAQKSIMELYYNPIVPVIPPQSFTSPDQLYCCPLLTTAHSLQSLLAARAISHPNLLPIQDIYTNRGHMHFVSDMPSGVPLKEVVSRGPLPLSAIKSIALQILEGLSILHDQRLEVGFMNSENVFLTPAGRVLITEYGYMNAANKILFATGSSKLPYVTKWFNALEKMGGSKMQFSYDITLRFHQQFAIGKRDGHVKDILDIAPEIDEASLQQLLPFVKNENIPFPLRLSTLYQHPGLLSHLSYPTSLTETQVLEAYTLLPLSPPFAHLSPHLAKTHLMSFSADIWAFGVIVYELITGHGIFPDLDSDDPKIVHRLIKLQVPPPIPAFVPALARELLLSCFQLDPHIRLSASSLKNHRFFSSVQKC